MIERSKFMEWIEPIYSKGQVDRAGLQLFGADADHLSNAIEAVLKVDNAYDIIGNWRSAHNYPLNIFQTGLRRRARKIDANCIVAQRIKRISSIHAKISRYPTMRLSMMQDIGGCRAIMNNVADVRTLVESYKQSDLKHVLTQEDNYIDAPKVSGYRGVHLIYRYHSDKVKTFNGLKIEVQIRSALQHAWATAVETVGTFIRQALKSSQGEADWLRFFALMGSVLAIREDTELVPDTPDVVEFLQDELLYYVDKLKVESHLQTYGAALKTLENSDSRDQYYLLELDPSAQQIRIQGYKSNELDQASAEYLAIERNMQPGNDAVLVSVDSMTALRRAYPNYFLDTHVFIDAVREVIEQHLPYAFPIT